MVAAPGQNSENAPVEASPTEVLTPTAGADDMPMGRPDGTPTDASVRSRSVSDLWLRVVCHLAAEIPLAVLLIVELARGWRPLFDNADLALRSYQVFSSHSPLVGHQMAVSVGSHAVFGPGPLPSWILAVPVRIDPAQGAQWGSVLAAVVAIALAIEALWAVGRWRGSATVAGCVLVLALVRPEVFLDPVWNVWFAALFLVPTFGTALAVATGRLRWWPVTVVAATVVVQSQAAYGPPAVALCIAAPVLGLVARRRSPGRAGGGWLFAGLAAAVLVWAAPVVQELAHNPGNLTLLVRAAGSGPTIGTTGGLRALGGATRVLPVWVHPLPTGSGLAQFFGVVGLTSGPEWWGLAVLGLLAVVGVLAARSKRPTLAVLAILSLVFALGAVATVATIPLSQGLVLGYLGVVLALVGLAVWVTFLWSVGAVLLVAARRRWGHRVDEVWPGIAGPARLATVVVLVGLSIWLVVVGLGQMDGTAPTLAGWPAVRATDQGSTAAAQVAPGGPFRLQMDGPPTPFTFAVETGIAYQLITRGLDPRPTTAIGYPTFGRPPTGGPTVVVEVPGPGLRVSAHLRTGS
jgi:hypothetical protein